MHIATRYPEKQPSDPEASKISRVWIEIARILSPTIYVSRPLATIDGSTEQIVAHGEDVMARMYEQAIDLDDKRYARV